MLTARMVRRSPEVPAMTPSSTRHCIARWSKPCRRASTSAASRSARAPARSSRSSSSALPRPSRASACSCGSVGNSPALAVNSPARVAADDATASPTGGAANRSATARSTRRSAVSWLGQDRRAWRRSARAVRRSPTSMWVSAEVRASHGSDAVAWAPRLDSARRSGRCSPLRTSATAKRRSRSDSNSVLPLAAAWSRAATGRCWSAHQRAAVACSSATRCGPCRCRSARR